MGLSWACKGRSPIWRFGVQIAQMWPGFHPGPSLLKGDGTPVWVHQGTNSHSSPICGSLVTKNVLTWLEEFWPNPEEELVGFGGGVVEGKGGMDLERNWHRSRWTTAGPEKKRKFGASKHPVYSCKNHMTLKTKQGLPHTRSATSFISIDALCLKLPQPSSPTPHG